MSALVRPLVTFVRAWVEAIGVVEFFRKEQVIAVIDNAFESWVSLSGDEYSSRTVSIIDLDRTMKYLLHLLIVVDHV